MARFPAGRIGGRDQYGLRGIGAACGSSLATTVAIGRFAIPEMLQSRYDRGLATGVCACAGTIGILIPPSIPMVIYGIFAGVPVTDLFIAGIVPGLLTAGAYTAMIVTRCAADPSLAPRTDESADRGAKWRALLEVWPFPFLALLVIGGLYAGWVTPTEAGALGAGASLVVALGLRTLTWRILWQAARETTITTAAILFVAIGAGLLTKLMAFSGVPQAISAFVAEATLQPIALIACVSLVYIVLGMFLDPLGLILLTLPIFLPLFQAQGLDLVWFGILLVKFVEIGLMTPPLGLNVYAAKSIAPAEVTLGTVFRGTSWFLIVELIVLALLIAIPGIATFLPTHMN